MPDKPVRAVDPLGIVALAKVLAQYGHNECGCELKPGGGCSCQDKPVCPYDVQCTCESKPEPADILEVMSNPVFREVVKGLDINRLKSIEDFVSIADEIRAKMNAKRTTRAPSKMKS
ncbi:hypothetical protein [Nitrospira sp. Ecomares 2.1]